MSAQQTLAPAFFASSSAAFTHSMCPGSRWRLAMATARNFFAVETHTSRSSATDVSGETLMVPGNVAATPATGNDTGGRMSALTPCSLSLAAPRRAISMARTVSVLRGRCGPCASIAPTGSIPTGRSFIASSTSVHVISDITMCSAMAIEGRLPSLLSAAQVLLVSSVREKTSPVDLSPVVLRQRRGELHEARVLEGRQALFHELLELTGQRVVAGALSRHHVGFGLDQSVGIFIPDHGAFRYKWVLEKAILDLVGGDEDPAHLEHLVGPPFVPEVAALVAPHVVAGHHPIAAQDLLGLVVGLPVEDGGGLALDPPRSRLARANARAARAPPPPPQPRP